MIFILLCVRIFRFRCAFVIQTFHSQLLFYFFAHIRINFIFASLKYFTERILRFDLVTVL